MKTHTLCALGAALLVPALVQPAMAEEAASPAEEFITNIFELQGAFAEVAEGIVDEKGTPAEGAAAINEINAALEALMASLPNVDPAVQAEIGTLMENAEIKAAADAVEKGCVEILAAFKQANFFDSDELKAACEKFAAVNQYAM